MKTLAFCLLLSIFYVNLLAQNLQIKDVWHFQKGDFDKDSLKQVLKSKKLYLKYNETVTIELQNTENQIFDYQYRILKSDKFTDWREVGNTPIIQLPILDGGEYVLEIATKQPPNKALFRLSINIKTVFWQEAWFIPSIIIYVLFLVGIGIYFFTLYNLRQKLKLQDVRNKIAADLHDEVGSNLNSIAIFVELLRKKSPKDLLPILDKITDNSKESVQLMQDTIWAIQVKNDDFLKFIDRMRGFATEILAAKNISLTFDNQIHSSNIQIMMESRKNIYLIFKEAINNIIKHSSATKAIIKIWKENNEVLIQIEDNGVGFDTNGIFEGNGLHNFETRAQESEIQVEINSIIGKGTTITMKF
jgi:signal transduction histidine kinase